jgi:hypothetical protein
MSEATQVVAARSWALAAVPGARPQEGIETQDRVLANGTVFAVADGSESVVPYQWGSGLRVGRELATVLTWPNVIHLGPLDIAHLEGLDYHSWRRRWTTARCGGRSSMRVAL